MKIVAKLIYYFQLPIRIKIKITPHESWGCIYVDTYFQYFCSQQTLVYKTGIKNNILGNKMIRINDYKRRLPVLIKKIKTYHENCS